MINKAIKFAANKHNGQNRKGKNVPYILHPLEVFNILYRMGADEDLLVAGLLHDVLEDADTTVEELKAEFSEDVAEFVEYMHSEEDIIKNKYDLQKSQYEAGEKNAFNVSGVVWSLYMLHE